TVNITHASGDAKSAFNSLPAIVKIMRKTPARRRATAGRAGAASCALLAAGQVDEHVFEARLRRLEAIQAPILLYRAPHQRIVRIAVPGKLQAEERRLRARHRGDAGERGELRDGRRPAQPDEHGGAALELLEGRDRVAVDDAAVMHDLHPVADRFHFGEDVGGEDHAVRPGELAYQGADFPDLVGIEADGGLVEDDD